MTLGKTPPPHTEKWWCFCFLNYNEIMESITLGEIATWLAFFAGMIGSGSVVFVFMRKKIAKIIQEELQPLSRKMDDVSSQVKQVDIENCKNYLQQTFSALDSGERMGSAAIQRFYEVYDHYTDDLHLNSWVHAEKERLESEGKLKRK